MSGHRWNPFLRFPRISLAVSILLVIPLIARIFQFEVSSETRVLLESDQRNFASYEKVMDILKQDTVLVVNMECEDVFSPEGINDVYRVSQAFYGQPGLVDVKSLTHSYKPVREGFSFKMVPLVPAGVRDTNTLERLRAFCLENPLIRNVMVAPDCQNTVLTMTYRRDFSTPALKREFRDEIERILEPFRKEGLKFQVISLPLVEQEVRSTMISDVKWFVPAAFVLLIVILAIGLKSPALIACTMANQLAVLLIIPGAIQFAGYRLNVFTIMLFPLLAAIHLTLLTHLATALRRMRAAGVKMPVEAMLEQVFRSCLFASLTTAVGLLSLAISDVRQVREFGLLGALGITVVFLLTFGPGVAVFKIFFSNPAPTGEAVGAQNNPPTSGPFITRCVDGLEKWKPFIWAFTGLALLVVVAGVLRLRTDVRAVEFLDESSPTRQTAEMFDRVYGGINVVQIHVDSGKTNGVNQPTFLHYLREVQNFAESKPEVSGVYSYAQLLAMMNQIWEGEAPGSLKVPESPLLLNIFVLALQSQKYPFLRALCDEQFQTAYLIVRTPDMPSRKYLDTVHEILGYANDRKPDGVIVSAREGLHSILEADRRILRSQVQTAGITVVVIGLVLTILWNSPLLALIALGINVIPVALVVAVAGLADVPMNSITVMVAAIAFGIAVDDSVHFITQWRRERSKTHSGREALTQTLRIKGRPIVYTSLILMGVFGLFFHSSFPPVAWFGILSSLAFLVALLAVLCLLPTLLSRLKR